MNPSYALTDDHTNIALREFQNRFCRLLLSKSTSSLGQLFYYQLQTILFESDDTAMTGLTKYVPLSTIVLCNIIIAVSAQTDLDFYKISWMGPVAMDTFLYEGDNAISISTKNKERYKCIIPDDGINMNFDTSAKNASTEDQNKNPLQYLEPLFKTDYCTYKFELFWVYELCHGKFLRQYHEENAKLKGKITQEYYLGIMDTAQIATHIEELTTLEKSGQPRPTTLVNGHSKPYVALNMTSGTKCDLTNQPRVSKVIYVCNEEPKHELYSIKEVSTCEYEAIVLSPLLCQHKDFKTDTSTQHEISCYSVDGSPTKPSNLIEAKEDEESSDLTKKRGIFLHGKTLIIDADLFFS